MDKTWLVVTTPNGTFWLEHDLPGEWTARLATLPADVVPPGRYEPALKREPSADPQAKDENGKGYEQSETAQGATAPASNIMAHEQGTASRKPVDASEPAVSAPDVAEIVKRLRLLPVKISECEGPRWEDFPKDQREGITRETAYSLGHAAGVLNAVQVAQLEIDVVAALLARLWQGWVPVSDEEALGAYLTGLPGKPIYAIDERTKPFSRWRFELPPLPPAQGASDE